MTTHAAHQDRPDEGLCGMTAELAMVFHPGVTFEIAQAGEAPRCRYCLAALRRAEEIREGRKVLAPKTAPGRQTPHGGAGYHERRRAKGIEFARRALASPTPGGQLWRWLPRRDDPRIQALAADLRKS